MISNSIKFKLYPSLLNAYDRFERGYLTEQELLDRINRVPVPQTPGQQKGVAFEEAVLRGIDEEKFDASILEEVRALLPRPMLRTQFYCEYQLRDVLFYGYVDVLGKMFAADIKTTSNYQPGCHERNHQNFYLPALRAKGVRSLRYIITDFEKVYLEEYDQTFDFSQQEAQVFAFCEFLEAHRSAVTDKRVFGA